MKKLPLIRLGNDIDISWDIKVSSPDGDKPYPLEGKNLTLYLVNHGQQTRIEDFTIDGNIILWKYLGKNQDTIGTFSLTLVENAGREDMHTVDSCEAFVLTRSSISTSGTSCGTLDINTVKLCTTVVLGLPGRNGDSAYEIARQNGFEGTEQEWLEELQSPAVEAGTAATEAAKVANTAATNANAATEKATAAADSISPLPFQFAGKVGHRYPIYNRNNYKEKYKKYFIRLTRGEGGETIETPLEPNDKYFPGYNKRYNGGALLASDEKRFICNQTVYRFTGEPHRELINVGIESRPNERLVRRVPSIHAHPGLLYLNRNMIQVGHKDFVPTDEPNIYKIYISKTYVTWKNGEDVLNRAPLMALPYKGLNCEILKTEFTDEKREDAIITIRNTYVGETAYTKLLFFDFARDFYMNDFINSAKTISVSFDRFGNKYFRLSSQFIPQPKLQTCTINLNVVKSHIRITPKEYQEERVLMWYRRNIADTDDGDSPTKSRNKPMYQIQIWDRIGNRQYGRGKKYKPGEPINHQYGEVPKPVWRWRNLHHISFENGPANAKVTPISVKKQHSYIGRVRVRKRNKGLSDWVVFRIVMDRHITDNKYYTIVYIERLDINRHPRLSETALNKRKLES
ncbi:MAG: hypothetical protein ACI3Y2_06770 [Candidatus Egerieousia sp.]